MMDWHTVPCKLWDGATNKDGYGHIKYNGRTEYVHRVAWIETHGTIPEGIKVLHHCDTPACYELLHLFVGTVSDNMQDREDKGRANHLRGSAHTQAKLTEDDVRDIKQQLLYGAGVLELASYYGVNRNTISGIKNGRGWRHVE